MKIQRILIALFCGSMTCAGFACTCIPKTIEEQVASSGTIFTARILNLEKMGRTIGPADKGFAIDYVLATLQVISPLKGEIKTGQELVVRTAGNEGICGFSFGRHHYYLIYANGIDDSLSTGLCSGTRGINGLYPNPLLEEEIALIEALHIEENEREIQL